LSTFALLQSDDRARGAREDLNMAAAKTTRNDASVRDFLGGIKNPKKRSDALAIVKLLKGITKKQPRMWGTSIVGFDQYHYKYDSGREGDMCMVGFSPRSDSLTLYINPGFERYAALMKRLGKHRTGQSCLHIRKLEDVDVKVLKELVTESYRAMKKKYA
jgi:hypothetical protein